MSTQHSLWEIAATLRSRSYEYVDLTHAFFPGQPKFAALPDQVSESLFNVAEHGFAVTKYSLVGQWGTHVDPPVHFVAGGRTLDELPVEEMILPLVVINAVDKVQANPNYALSLKDIAEWESAYGRIPEGAFVALRTDWSKRWEHGDLYGKDAEGKSHCPGWSLEALEFLHQQRGTVAIGHETTDTDPGPAIDRGVLECELYWLQQDRWQIELLSNLDQLPATGALIVATWAKPLGGTGFPARVFAVKPV